MAAEIMDWSPEQYHADQTAVSHTALDCFIEDPALYYGRHVARVWPQPDSEVFEFGRILHELFLFGRSLGDLVIQIPDSVLSKNGARAGGAWKEFKAECEADGRTPLFADDMERLQLMVRAVRRHPLASRLFQWDGPVEAPIVWTDHRGIKRRSMLDKLASGFCIGDLKGMHTVSEQAFKLSAHACGYHRQAAYYQEAVEELTGDALPFLFVAVQKRPSFVCEVIKLKDEFVELGRRENDEALDAMLECRLTGRWVRRGYGDILEIQGPEWALKKRELVIA